LTGPAFANLLLPHIADMEPYTPIEPFEVLSARLGRGPEQIIKLDANENPYGPHPAVREALLFRQRAFNTAPGLVGDGRDMGSVVFPHAPLKVFLTASAEARAERRYKQLIEKGFSANLTDLLLDLRQRDDRDSRRSVAPLRQEADARLLDTTDLTIEQAVNQVLEWSRKALQQGVTG